MKKNSLVPNNGLSLSQAQSISNMCYQRALEIQNGLNKINNASKSVTVVIGGSVETHETVVPNVMPKNVVELLIEKSKLHACQAFLMENIKAKDSLLKEVKSEHPEYDDLIFVEKPTNIKAVQIPEVTEVFGWEQLSAKEMNEYHEAVAYASHIGQFIHEGSILDGLRKELPKIPAMEWMVIKDGEKTPVKINVHHTSEELHKIHEELAKLHREHEQRVNYFKAKVKNLTTKENARIAKLNSDAQNDAEKQNNDLMASYETKVKEYNEKIRSIQAEFETKRQERISEIASMRINVDSRFQETIDVFLKDMKEKEEDKE